ncbi:hypothetical protein FNV43_RR21012 [Rhamnella rubrinervis]|uniref:Uncharacterized protein n=1 Tax=Rhamnella rubrinervis TaxID=2594499 RepID=A0A8K0GUQ2_9ROSA|nr:hypothetical protein FNV43_RR21012 [Rhamnella rubrinervis]
MGRGRAPCCDKSKVKRGPWSPAEDLRLMTFIQNHGHDNWRALPKLAGLLRCGKSCRLRWINYLRPDVKRGNFTKQEEDTIIKLHKALGNRWSKIASHLPGRTDNEIKNVWNTHLKKRLSNSKNSTCGHESKESSTTYSSSTSSSSSGSDFSSAKIPNTFGSESLLGNQLDGQYDKRTHHQDEKNPLKKVTSSLSVSSYGSDASNTSHQVVEALSSSPDDDRDQEDLDSLFDSIRGLNQDVNLDNEVDHQLLLDQVPLENDLAFWNMLENIPSFQPNDHHQANCQSSTGFDEENKKWFKYLETELGLEGTIQKDDDDDQDSMLKKQVPAETGFEALVEPQSDNCYPMWHSLP